MICEDEMQRCNTRKMFVLFQSKVGNSIVSDEEMLVKILCVMGVLVRNLFPAICSS